MDQQKRKRVQVKEEIDKHLKFYSDTLQHTQELIENRDVTILTQGEEVIKNLRDNLRDKTISFTADDAAKLETPKLNLKDGDLKLGDVFTITFGDEREEHEYMNPKDEPTYFQVHKLLHSLYLNILNTV